MGSIASPSAVHASDHDGSGSSVWKPRSPRLAVLPQLRERVLDRTAAWLAAEGVRRIALYGMGRHTRAVIRQPWLFHGIRVVAVLDDQPRARSLAGVPVMEPGSLLTADLAADLRVDAVVVSTTQYEDQISDRAHELFDGAGIRVVRLYTPDDSIWEPGQTIERIVACGIRRADAEWLVHNRGERHDAMLPIIPPARTELHARRYELAADLLLAAGGHDAADVACGTGYGSELLCTIGGAGRVCGVDLDPRAVAYAARYHHAGDRAEFRCADACDTGLASESFDLVASFETIEHVQDADGLLAELHRIMRPGATLVISTPNQLGPTPYHVHDFGFGDFRALLRARFEVLSWIGQHPGDEVYAEDLPPGMWRLSARHAERDEWPGGGGRPDFLIAVCRKSARSVQDPGVREIETPLGVLIGCVGHDGGPAATPEASPLWGWLARIGPDGCLWDLSDADPVPAVACGVRGVSALLLHADPRGHLVATELIRCNPTVRSVRSLGLTTDEGNLLSGLVKVDALRAVAGVPAPTHVRLHGFSEAALRWLVDCPEVVGLYVDRPETLDHAFREELGRLGFVTDPDFRGALGGEALCRGG